MNIYMHAHAHYIQYSVTMSCPSQAAYMDRVLAAFTTKKKSIQLTSVPHIPHSLPAYVLLPLLRARSSDDPPPPPSRRRHCLFHWQRQWRWIELINLPLPRARGIRFIITWWRDGTFRRKINSISLWCGAHMNRFFPSQLGKQSAARFFLISSLSYSFSTA